MSRTLLLPLRLASMPVSLFIAPMSAILSSLLFYTAATMYNLKTLRLASSYVTCPTSSFRRRKVAPLFSSTVVFMCFEECGTVFDMLSLVYVPDYRLADPNIKTSIGKVQQEGCSHRQVPVSILFSSYFSYFSFFYAPASLHRRR